MPILEIQNLTHTYGIGTPFQRSAVEDVSFSVEKGEFLGIIGHTGSGKSTLIQHLNGLLKPTSGQILLEGRDIWAEPKKIRNIRFQVGLVFQYPEYQLFEETVYKDISFGPKNQGLSARECEERAREALELVGFPEKYYRCHFPHKCIHIPESSTSSSPPEPPRHPCTQHRQDTGLYRTFFSFMPDFFCCFYIEGVDEEIRVNFWKFILHADEICSKLQRKAATSDKVYLFSASVA